MSKSRIVWVLVAVLLPVGLGGQAAWKTPNEIARRATAQAEAMQKTDPERAAALFKQAIEAAPDFFPAHDGYILAMKTWRMGPEPPEPPPPADAPKNSKGVPIVFPSKTRAIPLGGGLASAELKATYERWAGQYPGMAVMQWGLGWSQVNADRAAAEAALRRAIALDPRFSPAYRALALLAQLNRDEDARASFLRQAAAADPDDAQAALDVTDVLSDSERAPRLWAVVDRFPGTMVAYGALLRLSNLAAAPADKLPIYRRLWAMFPDERSYSHCWSMKTLFGLTTGDDPETALAVARRMDDVCVGDPDWPDLLAYEQKFAEARDLANRQQFAAALRILDAMTPPRAGDGVPFFLLRAEAQGAGDPRAAYENLASAAAREPKDALNRALAAYGARLGKTDTQVRDDVWAVLDAGAKPFAGFSLKRFDDGSTVSLADYRGRVVMVNFWFPGCGPCMNEFPYVEQALKKYRGRGFEVLGINIVTSEDPLVVPLLAERKFSFVALRMPDKTYATRTYNVTGAPANFLLDGLGRVMYRPAIHDRETARTFELEVELLLARAGR